MGNNLLTQLGYPYDKMIKSLENVKGCEKYFEFIQARISENIDWKAEIKALFEINKKSHHIVEICSHKPSEPEGIFKINNELGIIEAALIRYLFYRNEDTLKLINRVHNILKPLSKCLIGKYDDYVISLIIPSLEVKPIDALLREWRT